jgi:KUP system potassium uptake protein
MMNSPAMVADRAPGLRALVVLGALGVVYGDIGTSPLYAFKASLDHFKPTGVTSAEVLGVLSLIFWTLILVVTIKYVVLVMRADNRGEGGILSLMVLAQRGVAHERGRKILALVGIAGTCLFFGDGIITPAISVLSALEGLEVVSPQLREFVLPLSAAIMVVLFAAQSRGTASIGALFGPIMAVWFLSIAILGLMAIIQRPYVLYALLPTYGISLLLHYKWLGFIAMGSVVLVATGAEALYVDMGHFGRRPIQFAWLRLVLPALVLNYFGQGALVLSDPAAIESPFFLLCPPALRMPMVLLATAATVIASQAVISGAYSTTRQCMQLGFLPRMTVKHTSATEEGQIYVPQVTTIMLIGVLLLVFSFRTSDALAAAYGIAVTGTFICTGLLAIVVFRRQYHWSRLAIVATFGGLLAIDLVFFASNMLKIPDGGYVPLVLGIGLLAMMTSWHRGRDLLQARWRADSLRLDSFLARLPQSRTVRVPGMGIFMSSNPDFVPAALLHNLKHNKVLHERVLFVTVQNEDFPEVPQAERSTVVELAPGIHRVVVRYGFMESPNLPRDLAELRPLGIDIDPMQVSYFLGRETLVPDTVPQMPLWRLWLFLVLARNSVSATEFFRIPSDRVVELGVRVAI